MKKYTPILIVGLIVVFAIGLIFFSSGHKAPSTGVPAEDLGQASDAPLAADPTTLTATVTNTSSTVNMTDTLVNTPSNLTFFYAKNIGAGRIDCAWSKTTSTIAVAGTGLILEAPATTSTMTSFVTTDQNFLKKYMHCIASATSTLSILKY